MERLRNESVQRDTEFLAFKNYKYSKKKLRASEDTIIEVIDKAINLV